MKNHEIYKTIRFTEECTQCALRKDCRAPVPCAGNFKSKVMLVGEAPGKDEDEKGLPFIGQSGQIQAEAWEKLGINVWEKFVLSNTVKCRPSGNRTPTNAERDFCSRWWLHNEILAIQPKVILAVGKVALGFFLRFGAIANGCWTPIKYGDDMVQLHFLYHPSHWLRMGGDEYVKREILPAMLRFKERWITDGTI